MTLNKSTPNNENRLEIINVDVTYNQLRDEFYFFHKGDMKEYDETQFLKRIEENKKRIQFCYALPPSLYFRFQEFKKNLGGKV